MFTHWDLPTPDNSNCQVTHLTLMYLNYWSGPHMTQPSINIILTNKDRSNVPNHNFNCFLPPPACSVHALCIDATLSGIILKPCQEVFTGHEQLCSIILMTNQILISELTASSRQTRQPKQLPRTRRPFFSYTTLKNN